MMKISHRGALVLACCGLAACDENGTGPSEMDRTLADVRAATAQFQNVNAALAAGYTTDGHCVAHPTQGGMGVHYVKMALLQDGGIDPRQPEVLMYEPQPNGTMKFLGVEYMVMRQAWEGAQKPGTPTLVGQPFDAMFGEAAHGLPDHYELHVWTERSNASGRFSPWNPAVYCPAPSGGHAH